MADDRGDKELQPDSFCVKEVVQKVQYHQAIGFNRRFWSAPETSPTFAIRGGKHVQKTLLYLGEINDAKKAAWTKTITDRLRCSRKIAMFPKAWMTSVSKSGFQNSPSSVHASGVLAGWPANFGINSVSTNSGHLDSPAAAKQRRGSTSCSRWFVIG
jgi:hypothetical protein